MAELEREKRRLLKEKDAIEEEGIFSIDEVIGSLSASGMLGSKVPFFLNIVSRFAPFLGVLGGPIMNVARGWLSSLLEKHENGNAEQSEASQADAPSKIKTTLFSLGKEIVGSYLKWKAMELSYKGIKLIVKKQKEKKARKAANKEHR